MLPRSLAVRSHTQLVRPAAFLTLTVAAASLLALGTPAASQAGIIPQPLAKQNGLQRAWFTQVSLDPARHRIETVVLAGDQLLALTTSGVLQSIDAKTGATQWTTRIGNPDYPSLGPSVSEKYVSIVNGSTLSVIDRKTGREVMSRQSRGGVGGAPAISGDFAYIPLFGGQVEGFSLDETKPGKWYYSSYGRIFQDATMASNSVLWTTDRNALYVAQSSGRGVRYRFEATSPLGTPATLGDRIYAASKAGYLYALEEESGRQVWRYSAGFGIVETPVAIGEAVYLETEEPSLHRINAKTGIVDWVARGPSQFVCASETRVYALDEYAGLYVLDAKTGAQMSHVRGTGEQTAVVNNQTDRMYLVTKTGLVQCLHEIGAVDPFYHRPQKPEEETATEEEKPVEEAAEPDTEEPAADANPFGGDTPADPFGGEAAPDPFGGGAAPDPFAPAGDADAEESDTPAEDDPFGGFGDPF